MNFASNVQQFTYVSDMNGSNSTIDHFITGNSLLNYVNHSDVRDDGHNHSDHLPITLYMYIYVPIAKIAASNIYMVLCRYGHVTKISIWTRPAIGFYSTEWIYVWSHPWKLQLSNTIIAWPLD